MPFDLRHYANILRLLRLLRATHLVIDPGFLKGKDMKSGEGLLACS